MIINYLVLVVKIINILWLYLRNLFFPLHSRSLLQFWWLIYKEYACQFRRQGFDLWVRKMPWRRKWQPTLFLPGESHGQKSPVGYSPWGHKDGDVTVEVNSNSSNMPMSTYFTLGGPLSPSYSQRDWDSGRSLQITELARDKDRVPTHTSWVLVYFFPE